jgi:hypothetical protein
MTAVTIPLRAKDQLPMVLLTLLSIAGLGTRLLWSHRLERLSQNGRDRLSLQIGATLPALLIWLIYTSISMRFRWIPTPTDSVFPFFIGLIEFTRIVGLGPERLLRFFDLAVIFAVMAWPRSLAGRLTATTMRTARSRGHAA